MCQRLFSGQRELIIDFSRRTRSGAGELGLGFGLLTLQRIIHDYWSTSGDQHVSKVLTDCGHCKSIRFKIRGVDSSVTTKSIPQTKFRLLCRQAESSCYRTHK